MYSIPLLSFLGYFFPFINDQKPLSKTLDNLRCGTRSLMEVFPRQCQICLEEPKLPLIYHSSFHQKTC